MDAYYYVFRMKMHGCANMKPNYLQILDILFKLLNYENCQNKSYRIYI